MKSDEQIKKELAELRKQRLKALDEEYLQSKWIDFYLGIVLLIGLIVAVCLIKPIESTCESKRQVMQDLYDQGYWYEETSTRSITFYHTDHPQLVAMYREVDGEEVLCYVQR